MPTVRPFVGLLYDVSAAGRIETLTAPPYDAISPIDQERYYRASPHNVVRLELGKDEPGDDDELNKYTRAASYFGRWREAGVLRPTERASVFPYELSFHHEGSHRVVRGLVAEVDIEPWGGSIVPHERTLPGPIEDRLRLLRLVRANLSPVYTAFTGPSRPVEEFLREATAGPPAIEVRDEAGTLHRLWVAGDEPGVVGEALRDETLLIADGHHRYTVALAYRHEMQERFGPGPWDSMMMFLIDGAIQDPPVLPIHRVLVRGEIPVPANGERVRDMAEVLASLDDDALTYGTVHLEDGDVVHHVAALSGAPPTVAALHEQVLDRREDVEVRFVPDAVAAEHAVVARRAPAAFILPATRVGRVRQVVESGARLPQKSTYFWPKPRTGLVIRPLEPHERTP